MIKQLTFEKLEAINAKALLDQDHEEANRINAELNVENYEEKRGIISKSVEEIGREASRILRSSGVLPDDEIRYRQPGETDEYISDEISGNNEDFAQHDEDIVQKRGKHLFSFLGFDIVWSPEKKSNQIKKENEDNIPVWILMHELVEQSKGSGEQATYWGENFRIALDTKGNLYYGIGNEYRLLCDALKEGPVYFSPHAKSKRLNHAIQSEVEAWEQKISNELARIIADNDTKEDN